MPIYAYKCDICGTPFERIGHLDEDLGEIICPNGHAQYHRVYYCPTVIFKGSGFYINDSRKKPVKVKEGK
jgi:putative FmdB family regulatory protein